MIESEVVSSKENSKAKRLHLLHDRKKASAQGVVFIEGTRLCEDALKSGIVPELICFTPSRNELVTSWCELFQLDSKLSRNNFLCVTDDLFSKKIASTKNPQGIAMVVPQPSLEKEFPNKHKDKAIYVVLENLQDPGNMGTIIRMADAFDFDAVVITEGCCDPFNEKTLRSSMGSCWHIPIIKIPDVEKFMLFAKEEGIISIAMHLQGEVLSESELKLPIAFLIGNEGNGLSERASGLCDKMVKIPMMGEAESLNAASAASIIGYVLSTKR